MELQINLDVISGERTVYAHADGLRHEIGIIPPTKWKSFDAMQMAIVDLCEKNSDWERIRIACQSMIDAAPEVPTGDVSAQVFDPLKLLRGGSVVGDLLKRAAGGDQLAAREFSRAAMKEEMIRAFGSHIVRFTSVTGEGLGSGILLMLPDRTCAIMTCSHVWAYLTKRERVQIYCAATQGGLLLDQRMIQVAVDALYALDMADPIFMEQAGVDALLFRRDAAIIGGHIDGLFPIGARAFDLRGVPKLDLDPEKENYALVGYPIAAQGELGAQFLEYNSAGRNLVFTRHPRDERVGSLNGASGGFLVAVRQGRYRAVGMMVEEHGSVEEVSFDSRERSANPSVFHALPLADLRNMIEKAGRLPFRDREGRIVREC